MTRRKVYRDAWGRFISRAKAIALAAKKSKAPVRRYTKTERGLLKDVRRDIRRDVLPAGTEYELTATTRGGTPDRTRHGRIDTGRRARRRRRYTR